VILALICVAAVYIFGGLAIVALCSSVARVAHRLAHPYRARRARLGRLIAVALVVGSPAAAAPCGEERAAVKLGLDEEAKRIDTEAVDITIARLAALPRPGRISEATRASDVERTVWRVSVVVTGYKLEADGDYHVVIADEHGSTMIVEIPDPKCAAPGAWGSEIRAARAAFLAMLSARGFPAPAKKLHRSSIPVAVRGVGFYDRIHGQTGVAANGIELHPVLAIESGGGQ
jgi:hypothetical protein